MAEAQSWDELVSQSAPKKAAGPASWDELVSESAKDPGYLGEIGRGLKAGAQVQLPKMAGQALKFFGAEETGDSLIAGAEARNTADLQESPTGQAHDSAFSVRGNVYEAASNAVPSLAPGAAGAAIGAGIGTFFGPGPGTAAGALIGYAAGSIASLPMFYGSQAQESYEAVKKTQLEAGKSEAEAGAIATRTAHAEGTIEAGGELAADIIPFAKLFKPLARPATKAAGSLVKDTLLPTFKQAAKTTAQVVGGEVATEMAQQAGEDYVRKEMGDTGPGATWHETSKVIMPTALMSLIPGAGGAAASHLQRRGAVATLVDPEADPDVRAKIALGVAGAIEPVDATVSRAFAGYAAEQIKAGKPIEIGSDAIYLTKPQPTLAIPSPVVAGQSGESIEAQAARQAAVDAAESNAAKIYAERAQAEAARKVLDSGSIDGAIQAADQGAAFEADIGDSVALGMVQNQIGKVVTTAGRLADEQAARDRDFDAMQAGQRDAEAQAAIEESVRRDSDGTPRTAMQVAWEKATLKAMEARERAKETGNAIPEQVAGTVDVRQQAGNGEALGVGNAQPEGAAGAQGAAQGPDRQGHEVAPEVKLFGRPIADLSDQELAAAAVNHPMSGFRASAEAERARRAALAQPHAQETPAPAVASAAAAQPATAASPAPAAPVEPASTPLPQQPAKPVLIFGRTMDKLTRKELEVSAKKARTAAQREAAAAEIDRRADEKAGRPLSPAEEARRTGLRQQAAQRKRVDVDRDSLIQAVIKLGGISPKERLDITGDTRGDNPSVMGVGYLFSSSGTGTDDMATRLGQYGYLSQAELDDVNGGVQALKDKIADELRGARKHWSMSGQVYDREAGARAAAEDAEALERERPAGWDTMTEEQKDAELDSIFGADSREKPAAGGQEAGAGDAAEEMGRAEQAPGEREPGQDDEEVARPAQKSGVASIEPEPIEGSRSSPTRPPNDRWYTDPGVIPGEPMLLLDVVAGDLDTAKAAIIEREIPGKGVLYDATDADGNLIGTGQTPEEAASIAEGRFPTSKKPAVIGGYPVSGMGDKALKTYAEKSGNHEHRQAAQDEINRRAAPAERPALDLAVQTEASLKAKKVELDAAVKKTVDEEAVAEAKRKADAERGDFALTGSDRGADANPNQSGLFGGAVAALRTAADELEKVAKPKADAKPEGKLTDVGENLWYNRRNFTGKATTWGDVKGLNDALKVKEVVKAKVWPKPDYAKLVAEGLQPFFARLIKQVYDGIGTAPAAKSDADLQRYIDVVSRIREAVFDWAKDNNANREFLNAIVARAKPYARAERGEPVSLTSMIDTKPADIRNVILDRVWPETKDKGSGKFYGTEAGNDLRMIGGRRTLAALQFTVDDAVEAMKDIEKGWPASQEAWQRQGMRIAPASQAVVNEGARYDDGARTTLWNVSTDVGWKGMTIGDSYDTKAAAEAARAALKPFMLLDKRGRMLGNFETEDAAKAAARERTKREGNGGDIRGMNISEAERKGPERRKGENITPERLMSEFGFRGVNFGRESYINQAERQAYLNHAFDGLHDLAEILEIPPKALSLNGMLGLAFGAQGRGGTAAAHFVPGVNEINLTKTMGAGTLAHEWGHALDHYFATQGGLAKNAEPYMSAHAPMADAMGYTKRAGQKVKAFGDDLRPEIAAAFKVVVEAMDRAPLTAEEIAQRSASALSVGKKNLDSWIDHVARRFNDGSTAGKGWLESFDKIAKRLREGDVGEGFVKSGNKQFPELIAKVREMVKGATGRLLENESTEALDANASRVKYLLSEKAAAAAHEPQTGYSTYRSESYRKDRDKGGKPYWATPWEMFARAFETYVSSRLQDIGQGNTFLSDAANRAEQRDRSGNGYASPYPRGDDRTRINAAIDKLVSEIETKETDKGVAMFSRAAPTFERTEDGPVLVADGVGIVQPSLWETRHGMTMYEHTIVDAGGKPIGVVTLGWIGDKASFLPNIRLYSGERSKGVGEAVIRALVEHNGPGQELTIGYIEAAARGFWSKMGVRIEDTNEGTFGQVSLESYRDARPVKTGGDSQRVEGGEGPEALGQGEGDARAYRRAPGRYETLAPQDVRRIIAPILKNWGNAPEVRVIASVSEAPEVVQRMDVEQREGGAKGEPEAFINSGTVYLVANGLSSEAAVVRALFHESFGHYGLKGVLGDRIVTVLNEVVKSAPKRVEAKAKEYGLNWENEDAKLIAAEEVLAEIAQARPTLGLVRRAIAIVRKFLRDLGISLALSENDIISEFILPARRFVTEARQGGWTSTSSAFSRAPEAAVAPTYTVPSWAESFDDAKKAALRKAGVIFHEDTLKDRARALTKDFGKSFIQGVVDQFAPLKDLDPVAYMKARLSRATDGGVEALLLYGKPFLRDGAIDVDVRDNGFLKVLQGLKNEHDRFFAWVAGQRAGELKAKGKENLLTDEDLSFLRTLDRSDGSWDARQAAYAEALRQLQAYNKAVLDIAERQGIIDGESRPLWESQFYVPFYRVMEDGVAGSTVKSGLVRQYAFKKLKGGTQNLNDLAKNTLMNWSHLLSAAQKNAAAKASLEAAVAAGIAEEVEEGTKNAVWFLEKGVKRSFVVSDPHVMDAISSLEWAGFGPWMKPMAAFKRWLTFGVTANPAFKVRNLIRDSLAAIGQNDMSYKVWKNVAQGWRATEHSSQTRASLMAGGGMFRFGTILEGDRAQHLKQLIESGVSEDTVLDTAEKVKAFFRKTWDAYQEFGDRSENINRAALYEQLIAQGKNHLEASYLARDMLDFSMSGKWAAIRFLTQSVPFMNARLQGLYKLGRAVKEDPVRAGYVTGAIALASLALLIGNEDDDDWKKREDWDRDTYWWFKFGGAAFRIPKPFELGAIGTIVERTYELAFNKEMSGKRYAQRMADIASQNFSMSPVPQLVKPLVDMYANQDSFSGRPIETMGMERLRKEDRYTAHTTYAARALGMLGLPDPLQLMQGRYEGISPAQADFLIRGYFGWMGTMTATAADYGIRPLAGAPEKPSMQLRDVFLAGNFVEGLPANSSRYVTDFYNQAKEIEQAYGSYREALKHGDVAKAREIFEAEREKISKYKSTEAVKRLESQITLKIRRIETSNAPAEDKRRLIDMLERQKDLAARRITAAH